MKYRKETLKRLCFDASVSVVMSAMFIMIASKIDGIESETVKKPFEPMPIKEIYQEEIVEESSEAVFTEPAFITTEDEGVPYELPSINTNVKFFTDYRCYNLWYTPHYRLQQAAWTDAQGLRRYNEDYIVALGSYYSKRIGDRFKVTLDTGRSFTVIFGDGKWDEDCDSRCMYTPCTDYEGVEAANLLEFIVDENVLDKNVYEYGSIEKLDGFEGNIVEMSYLGRDVSQDWDTYETVEEGE